MYITFFQTWCEWSRKRIPEQGREHQQWCTQCQGMGSYHLSMRWYSKSLFSRRQMKSLENLCTLRLSKRKITLSKYCTVKSQLYYVHLLSPGADPGVFLGACTSKEWHNWWHKQILEANMSNYEGEDFISKGVGELHLLHSPWSTSVGTLKVAFSIWCSWGKF